MNNEILNTDKTNEAEIKNPKHRKLRVSDIIAYVLCLAISFGIWFYVASLENENYEYTFENVTVQLEGVNELKNERNLSILNGYDTKINITVVGSRREILKYTAEDIYAHVNLDSVKTADRHSLDVMIDLPDNDNIKIESVTPAKVNLFVDETVTITVDLKIDPLYNISSDLTLHAPEPSVEKISVTGPKTILDEISYAQITNDLGTVTTSVTFNSTIKLVDSEGNEITNPYIKTDVTDVMVTYPVTMEKLLPLTPDYSASDDDSFNYSVTFEPQMVRVEGDPQIISAMKEIKVNVGDITNTQGGTVTANKLELPDGVELHNKDLKTISYAVIKNAIDTESK